MRSASFFKLATAVCVLAGNPLTSPAQTIGIGTHTPHPSARLDIHDTSRGLLIPRLTTQQRNAIQNSAHTLIIFNIDSFCLEAYDTLTQQWYTISCPRNCFKPSCTPTISGPSFACSGDTIQYIVQGCPTGTIYQWWVPNGWTILSGTQTNTLTVIPDTTSGTIAVAPCNPCGCGRRATLSVIADTCTTFCLTLGGPLNEIGRAIIQDQAGALVLIGYAWSFGQGAYDVYVARLIGPDSLSWTRTLGGTDYDYGYALVQTTDGGYALTGYTWSFGQGARDVYIAKLDSMGNLQWTKTIGGPNHDWGLAIVETHDHGLAIAGITSSFGQGGYDLYLIKLDAQGNLQWTRTFGGANYEWAFALIQTADSGFAIAGRTLSFGQGNWDVYVVKLDAAGNLQWTRAIGGTGNDQARSIVQTHDGGYALAGYTTSFGQGNADVYVIKLDSAGNLQWTRTIGGNAEDRGYAIIQTSDGGYALAGYTTSFGQGNRDVYLVKLDTAGNLQWTRTIGDTADEVAYDLLQTDDQGFVLIGYTTSVSTGASTADVYIVKVDGNGNIAGCTSGCLLGSGGVIASGGIVTTGGGTPGNGGTAASGGTPSAGGTLTRICP